MGGGAGKLCITSHQGNAYHSYNETWPVRMAVTSADEDMDKGDLLYAVTTSVNSAVTVANCWEFVPKPRKSFALWSGNPITGLWTHRIKAIPMPPWLEQSYSESQNIENNQGFHHHRNTWNVLYNGILCISKNVQFYHLPKNDVAGRYHLVWSKTQKVLQVHFPMWELNIQKEKNQ